MLKKFIEFLKPNKIGAKFEMKKVSIIVPTYNMENRVGICIESLLLQSYKNIEIIVIDDGSTDKTYSICNQYAQKDKRVKLITKPNSGVADATNMGLEQVTGNYILFVDSDDYIEKNVIEIMVSNLEESNADVVQGGARIENENGNIISIERYEEQIIDGVNKILKFHLFNGIIGGNLAQKLFKSELFFDLRLPEGRNLADITTMISILKQCHLYKIIPDICYVAVKRVNSVSLAKLNEHTYNDILYYIKCLNELNSFQFKEITWYIDYAKLKMLIQAYNRVKSSNTLYEKKCKLYNLKNLINQQYKLVINKNAYYCLSKVQRLKLRIFRYCPNIYAWLSNVVYSLRST